MSSGARGLLALLVICATLELGTSLRCYSCSSFTHKGCGPDINPAPENLANCPAGTDTCLKMIDSNTEIEVRTCGVAAACRMLKDCHTCTSDLCNSSLTVLPSFTITSMICLITALFWMNY